jgi:LemA protein
VDAVLVTVLLAVVVVVTAVAAFTTMYNKFARQRNTIEESWRQIDVELQRRHDLIGNLVEVTRAAARFEQETLARVVQARGRAVAAHGAGPAAQGQAEQQLNGALTSFFAVAEQYPTLTANQNFRHLQEQMVECEDRIAAGRRFYNGNVRAFNTRFDTFPSSLVAGAGKFRKKEYYEVDDPGVRAAPALHGAFDRLNEPVTPTPPLGQPMIEQPAMQHTPPVLPGRPGAGRPYPGGAVPRPDGEPGITPHQPPQAPPAPPLKPPRDRDDESSGPMPENRPQTPPAPPIQPPQL